MDDKICTKDGCKIMPLSVDTTTDRCRLAVAIFDSVNEHLRTTEKETGYLPIYSSECQDECLASIETARKKLFLLMGCE